MPTANTSVAAQPAASDLAATGWDLALRGCGSAPGHLADLRDFAFGETATLVAV